MDPPSSRGDNDVDGEGGDAGGGRAGATTSRMMVMGSVGVEHVPGLEEEGDDDGYGTPAGAPDSTATVRR